MLASELFKMIESRVPMELALSTDTVGFIGPGNPETIEVNKVLVVLDYHRELELEDWDLVVSHHPPLVKPNIPTYVIHSNWDIVQGGANDALAESLKIKVLDVFDTKTGIGRICSADISLEDFLINVADVLKTEQLNVVRKDDGHIGKLAIVSGFGLNPEYIQLAYDKGVDLFLSGDLTHKGALTAIKLGIFVVDATHQATEVPGLIRLCRLISEFGLTVEFEYPQMPWEFYVK